jgi:hypothetical protein
MQQTTAPPPPQNVYMAQSINQQPPPAQMGTQQSMDCPFALRVTRVNFTVHYFNPQQQQQQQHMIMMQQQRAYVTAFPYVHVFILTVKWSPPVRRQWLAVRRHTCE